MKLMYGNIPVKSLNIHTFERDTNDATLKPSDMQAGVTAYAKGKKVVGTGKAFAFASYGNWKTNQPNYVPTTINTIHIGSLDYLVKMTVAMNDATLLDFSTPQKIAEVTIDNIVYPVLVSVQNGRMAISCDKTIDIELFYGKDEYA